METDWLNATAVFSLGRRVSWRLELPFVERPPAAVARTTNEVVSGTKQARFTEKRRNSIDTQPNPDATPRENIGTRDTQTRQTRQLRRTQNITPKKHILDDFDHFLEL